ncbi:MAG TPA: methyltransferase domain-containing protein [Candidatus Binatia bacterium]|nr:methyltransferase domain-containing protein [Candidatus Binatia bacterium]
MAGELAAVRRFWDARPCNLRHSPAPLGTRAYFDEVEARKYRVEPHIPGFADFARWRGRRVLEVGCGIGTDTVSFARAGADVTAVDLSGVSLGITRDRLAAYGLTAKLVQGSAEDLGFLPEAHFDLVYSFGVVHHTPHPERAIAGMRRVLAPGGELRLMVYNRWSYKALGICARGLLRGKTDFARLVREASEAQSGCPVTFLYSDGEARRLLAGFAIVSMRNDHVFPYVIADYVAYRYRKHWWFRLMPDPLYAWLCARLGWHKLVVARKAE